MTLKKNVRKLGYGRLSSVCDNGDGIDVFIADKHGIIKKRFDASRQTLVSEGRVSFAEDYFDLGFVEVEKRLLLRSVDKS